MLDEVMPADEVMEPRYESGLLQELALLDLTTGAGA